MRKTSLDLDHESTIISILAINDLPRTRPPSKSTRHLKSARYLKLAAVACVALLLAIVAMQGNTAWQ